MRRIVFIVFLTVIVLTKSFAQQQQRDSVELLLNKASVHLNNDTIIALPIDYKKAGLILLKVQINGKEYWFVFDTGASTCLISKEIAEQSKIITSISYKDANGSENKADIVLQNFEIGSIKFNDVATILGDLKFISELSCLKIDGIIGANLINLCNWQINPESQRIYFSKRPFPDEIGNSSKVKLEYTPNGLPLLKLQYDNIPFYALVDLGYVGYLDLNKDILKKSKRLKKVKTFKGSGIHSISANSVKESSIVHAIIDTLSGENFKALYVPTNFDDVKPLIGASFFRRYIFSLNTSNNEALLSPLEHDYQSYQFFPIKLGLNKSNELIINFIWETEQLKQAGIKVGQRVISIDNKIFSNLSSSELCDLKDYINAADKINITIQVGGETKTIEIFKSTY